MRKILPYIGAGAAAVLLLFWLIKIAFPTGSGPEVKRLQAQVDSLKQEAAQLRVAVAARDQKIDQVNSQIGALNTQIVQVRSANAVVLTKLKQDWRIHDTSDAELVAGLNRAHSDTTLLKGSGPVPR